MANTSPNQYKSKYSRYTLFHLNLSNRCFCLSIRLTKVLLNHSYQQKISFYTLLKKAFPLKEIPLIDFIRKKSLYLLGASSTACLIASIKLFSSAMPFPAISKAVPWSTLVRMIGNPTVMLTPASNPSTFTGPWPWS